jgi:hypothetical protein
MAKHLNQMKLNNHEPINPEEAGYLLGLITQPLEYYRQLNTYSSVTLCHENKLEFLETLRAKLIAIE